MKKSFVLILMMLIPILVFAQASGGQIRRSSQQTITQQRNSQPTKKRKLARNEVLLEDGKTIVRFETSKAVDLGLPSGTIWAGYNIGADSPKDTGDYYAWGEINEKENYSSADYFDIDKTIGTVGAARFKKYNNRGVKSIIGTDRDVAQATWGNPWRMPSMSQIDELEKYCSVYLAKFTGDSRMYVIFKGPNGKAILFPYSGMKQGRDKYENLGVYCWSGELKTSEDFSHSAFCLHASVNGENVYVTRKNFASGVSFELRWYGMNVRAVRNKY